MGNAGVSGAVNVVTDSTGDTSASLEFDGDRLGLIGKRPAVARNVNTSNRSASGIADGGVNVSLNSLGRS